LLYQTYREVVTAEDAARYFQLVPRAVEEEQDTAAKEAAECESNCGRALRDSLGSWVPVDPVIPDDYEPIPVSDWILENV